MYRCLRDAIKKLLKKLVMYVCIDMYIIYICAVVYRRDDVYIDIDVHMCRCKSLLLTTQKTMCLCIDR